MSTKTRTIEAIQDELDDVNGDLIPLMQRSEELRKELRTAKSLQWIAVNGVTFDQVIRPEDCERWLGDITAFRTWLLTLPVPRKRFASWNGSLYQTKDLIANGLRRETPPGNVYDLPGYKG